MAGESAGIIAAQQQIASGQAVVQAERAKTEQAKAQIAKVESTISSPAYLMRQQGIASLQTRQQAVAQLTQAKEQVAQREAQISSYESQLGQAQGQLVEVASFEYGYTRAIEGGEPFGLSYAEREGYIAGKQAQQSMGTTGLGREGRLAAINFTVADLQRQGLTDPQTLLQVKEELIQNYGRVSNQQLSSKIDSIIQTNYTAAQQETPSQKYDSSVVVAPNEAKLSGTDLLTSTVSRTGQQGTMEYSAKPQKYDSSVVVAPNEAKLSGTDLLTSTVSRTGQQGTMEYSAKPIFTFDVDQSTTSQIQPYRQSFFQKVIGELETNPSVKTPATEFRAFLGAALAQPVKVAQFGYNLLTSPLQTGKGVYEFGKANVKFFFGSGETPDAGGAEAVRTNLPGVIGAIVGQIATFEVLGVAAQATKPGIFKIMDYLNPYASKAKRVTFTEAGRGIVEGGIAKVETKAGAIEGFPITTVDKGGINARILSDIESGRTPLYLADNPTIPRLTNVQTIIANVARTQGDILGGSLAQKALFATSRKFADVDIAAANPMLTAQRAVSQLRDAGYNYAYKLNPSTGTYTVYNVKTGVGASDIVPMSRYQGQMGIFGGVPTTTVQGYRLFTPEVLFAKKVEMIKVKAKIEKAAKDVYLMTGKKVSPEEVLYNVETVAFLKLKNVPSQLSSPAEQFGLGGQTMVLAQVSPGKAPFKYNIFTGRSSFVVQTQPGSSILRSFTSGVESGFFFAPAEKVTGIPQAYTHYAGLGGERASVFSFLSGEELRIGKGTPTITLVKEQISKVNPEILSKPITASERAVILSDLANVRAGKVKGLTSGDAERLLGRYGGVEGLALHRRLATELNKPGEIVPGVGGLSGLRTEYEAIGSIGTGFERTPKTLRGTIGQVTGKGDIYIRLPTGEKLEVIFAKKTGDTSSITGTTSSTLIKAGNAAKENYLRIGKAQISYEESLKTPVKYISPSEVSVVELAGVKSSKVSSVKKSGTSFSIKSAAYSGVSVSSGKSSVSSRASFVSAPSGKSSVSSGFSRVSKMSAPSSFSKVSSVSSPKSSASGKSTTSSTSGKSTPPSPPNYRTSGRSVVSLLKSASSKISSGFKTFFIRGGKKEYLPGIAGRTEAIKKGEAKASSSLTATFGVEATNVRVKSIETDYKPNEMAYRSFRLQSGRKVQLENQWIQKAGTRREPTLAGARLASRGERMELSGYRKAKPVKLGGSKVGSGRFSLL